MTSLSSDRPSGQTPPIVQRDRLSHAEQIADKCVHFTGTSAERCAAGVRYVDVTVNHAPIAYQREGGPVYTTSRSLPCLVTHNMVGAVCEKRCAYTPEQIEERVASTQRSITDTMEAHKRINAATAGERGVGGTIECPRCSQPLHYSVAASNGHVWGRCSTQGCLAWMQ